jgi:polyphenol oxidase
VTEVTGAPAGAFFAGEGDALWTRETGTALLIRTADCLPILFYSKSEPLVGAVHAGWRGFEKRILSRALEKVACGDLDFFVGPFIGGNSYEVGSDVAGHFDRHCSKELGNGKFLLDLRAVLEGELKAAGIDRSRVTWYADDTLNSGWWYSARGGDQQRNLALIWRAPR